MKRGRDCFRPRLFWDVRLLDYDRPLHRRMNVAGVVKRAGDRERPIDRHAGVVARDVRRCSRLSGEEDIVGHGSERKPDNATCVHVQRRGAEGDRIRRRNSVRRWRRWRRPSHRSVTAAAAEQYSHQRNDGELCLEPEHLSLPGMWCVEPAGQRPPGIDRNAHAFLNNRDTDWEPHDVPLACLPRSQNPFCSSRS
jgi:hypothetical protein